MNWILRDQPKKPVYVITECRVASLPRSNIRNNLESFAESANKCITLERDPQNKSDQNAIKIIGIWQDKDESVRVDQIGWVPSDAAYDIAVKTPNAPIYADTVAGFEPADIRGPNIRIRIWSSK